MVIEFEAVHFTNKLVNNYFSQLFYSVLGYNQ